MIASLSVMSNWGQKKTVQAVLKRKKVNRLSGRKKAQKRKGASKKQ
jgi:hypothetical protein